MGRTQVVMFVLGITGGIGTGKSTVASICRKAGLPVIDADQIAHDLTDQAGETTEKIAQALGQEVLDGQRALDRQRVADLAFSNKRALDLLSAIVHEAVVKEIERQLETLRSKKSRAVVLDVPIPVKRGFLDVCDQVWTVAAPDRLRVERLRRRGMDEAEVTRRIGVQMTREEYRDLAQ
ncbi:MAG TPA: dephospho-CoA kinase, partial [Clostridia bacterium]|nr:dephospho-CoA kinase [Clostridia bacterium]